MIHAEQLEVKPDTKTVFFDREEFTNYEVLREIQYKKLLDVKEVCIYLGMGENTVRSLLTKPKNPFTVKLGNKIKANKNELDKWIDGQCGNYNGISII